MNKTFKWLSLFGCIIGFFMSGMIFDNTIRTIVALGFFLGIVTVFIVDGLCAMRIQKEKQSEAKQRVENVLQCIENTESNLKVINKEKLTEEHQIVEASPRNIDDSLSDFKVTCPSGIDLGLFIFMLGSLSVMALNSGVIELLFGTVMILLGGHLILTAIPRMESGSVLILTRIGFKTPEYGLIPWAEVNGIALGRNTFDNITAFDFIVFDVPTLNSYRKQFHFYTAFIFALRSKTSRNKASVILRDANELPNVIINVAEELMKKATIKEHMLPGSLHDCP